MPEGDPPREVEAPPIEIRLAGTFSENQLRGDTRVDRVRLEEDHLPVRRSGRIVSEPRAQDTAGRTSRVPRRGEIVFDYDQGVVYYGDGSTAGGKVLRPKQSGTAFPGSPSAGDVFYRSDLDDIFYFDGDRTKWLGLAEIVLRGFCVDAITNAYLFIAGNPAGKNIRYGPYSSTAGAVDPDAVSGLEFWYEAELDTGGFSDGADVTAIDDLSSNGRNAAPTGAAKATYKTAIRNGRAVYRHSRDDGDGYTITGYTHAASDYTLIIAFEPDSTAGQRTIIEQNSFYCANAEWGGSGHVVYGDGASHEIAPPTAAWQILSFVLDSGANRGEVFRNGVSLGSSTYSADEFTSALLWCQNQYGSGHLDADIAAAAFYDVALSSTDRINVELGFAAKLAIAHAAETTEQIGFRAPFDLCCVAMSASMGLAGSPTFELRADGVAVSGGSLAIVSAPGGQDSTMNSATMAVGKSVQIRSSGTAALANVTAILRRVAT